MQPHQEDIAEGFGTIPVQILLIVIAAPVSEEVCFRGMLFGGLREKLPRVGAALIAGLVFGGLHALTGVTRGATADRLRLPAWRCSTRRPARSCRESSCTC